MEIFLSSSFGSRDSDGLTPDKSREGHISNCTIGGFGFMKYPGQHSFPTPVELLWMRPTARTSSKNNYPGPYEYNPTRLNLQPGGVRFHPANHGPRSAELNLEKSQSYSRRRSKNKINPGESSYASCHSRFRHFSENSSQASPKPSRRPSSDIPRSFGE